ncbi:NAD-binding protein [Nocardioides sp.]|uniref:NAD-binding protein n=1 Tax=Nocardioides sp. TaxID=35761 RepID=UPI003783D5B2
MPDRAVINVGIVGYGLVGRAVASRLTAQAGIDVTTFENSDERRSLAVEDGTALAGDIDDLLSESDLVLICVRTGSQALDLLAHLSRSQFVPHVVLGLMTTLTPAEEQQANAMRRAGLRLGVIPVSGTSGQIQAGDALVIYDVESSEALEPYLAVIEEAIGRSLNVGSQPASVAKLALNLVVEGNRAVLAEGFRFASLGGIRAATFLSLVASSTAASSVAISKGPKFVSRDFGPESRLAQSLKDVQAMLTFADNAGQVLPVTRAVGALLEDAVADGFADDDSSAVLLSLEGRPA